MTNFCSFCKDRQFIGDNFILDFQNKRFELKKTTNKNYIYVQIKIK